MAFRLEPDTPPGEYPAEVEVGGIRREAVLRVEPDLSMHVSPRRMLAEVGRHPLTVTVANDGNLADPAGRRRAGPHRRRRSRSRAPTSPSR